MNDTGTMCYREQLGMLGDADYKHPWQEKNQSYHDHGMLPHEESGGLNGTLITTCNDPKGGIDSSYINRFIEEVFDV